VLRRTGINPLNSERWWRFRLPGYGSVDWKGLFTVLQEAAYQGALNIEHEDEFYYPPTTEPSSPNPTNPASAWPTNSCASTCPSSRRGIPIQCCGRVGARLRLAQRLARDQEVLVQVSAPRLSPRLSA
jgi:hypothetical protein